MSEGKNILVTGASRGMGNAIAKKISHRCNKLLVTSSCEKTLQRAFKEIGENYSGELFGCFSDNNFPRESAKKIGDWANECVDHLDALVLNAGMFIEGAICEIDDDSFISNFNVNFQFNHFLVKELIGLLRKGETSRIIIIGSTAAYEIYPAVPTYGVAKFALRGYAINLRHELMKDKIGVTFISPGGTLTDMWEGENIEKGRLLEPEDIAKVIDNLFELSEQAVVEELIIRPILGDIHE